MFLMIFVARPARYGTYDVDLEWLVYLNVASSGPLAHSYGGRKREIIIVLIIAHNN